MPISKLKPRKQAKLFGIALAIKRGEVPASYSKEAAKIAKSLSEAKIEQMIKEAVRAAKRKTAKARKARRKGR